MHVKGGYIMANMIKDEVKNRLSPAQKAKIRKLRAEKQKKDTIGNKVRGFFGIGKDDALKRTKRS